MSRVKRRFYLDPRVSRLFALTSVLIQSCIPFSAAFDSGVELSATSNGEFADRHLTCRDALTHIRDGLAEALISRLGIFSE